MAGPVSNLTDLVNNVAASVDGLIAEITGKASDGSVPANPNFNVLSDLNPGNWIKLSFPYTFSVVNIAGGGSTGGFSDFSLPLAPTAIKQDEEFAISIRPTQGGTTTNHGGNRYKSLSIKGTTGIAPFRGTGGVKKKNGEAIFQPKALKYKSGYEVFIRFRNWLRAYYELKKNGDSTTKNLRLVFKNYKDGEFLIVELLKFTMDRQGSRSFLYDYELEFKVISHYKFAGVSDKLNFFDDALETALDAIDTSRGVFLRSQDILRQIEGTYESVVVEPLRKTSLALKALLGVGSVAADMGSKAISNTVSAAAALAILLGIKSTQTENANTGTADSRIAAAVLPSDLENASKNQGASAINDLGEALMALDPSVFPETSRTALAEEQTSAQQLPRSFFENALDELERVKQNAEDFFNLGDAEYDALFNRTSTLSSSSTKVITSAELDLLKAFNDAAEGLQTLLSTEDLFKSGYDDLIRDMISRFGGNINLFIENSVRQIRYENGTTIERLAQQELGDSSRWGEIVELNGLKAPYVTDDASDSRPNLLKPGDFVLIPTPTKNGFTKLPKGKENKLTENLSELEKSFGTDFKIDSNFDLVLNGAGDLELVSGTDNLAQSIILNLSYEQGDVIRYPQLGAGLLIGSKMPSLEILKDRIVNTLLQNNRIDTINDLSLVQDNSAITLGFNVKAKQVDIPIPIKIRVA